MPPTNAAPETGDDSVLLTNFMPNRTHARLWRFVARVFIGMGIVFGVQLLGALNAEIYARHHWPSAEAMVLKLDDKSGAQVGGHQTTVYWMKIEVAFAVPVTQCKTGTYWVPSQFPCIGIISTLPTQSWAEAQTWLRRHPPSSSTQVRYDPLGPNIRFVDESLWDVYSWRKFVALLVLLILGVVLHRSAQRRLRYLETLPEDYDASPPPSPDEHGPNEIIDLKLS